MSKEDIDKAVKEAEAFAAEDKKRKEEVDVRNNADQMIFQCEKTLKDAGDKISAEDKASVEPKINELREALKGSDLEAIKAKQEELQKAFYAVSEKMYQAAAAAQQAQAGANGADPNMGNAGQNMGGNANGSDYVDADFTEVKDDDNNK